MRTETQWLKMYGETHQHPVNRRIHMICVPAIFWSVTAILWSLPTPSVFQAIPYLNWATLVSLLALGFYSTMGFKAFFKMLVVMAAALGLNAFLASIYAPLLAIGIGVFVAGWIGQFYGHKIEGKKPAFFDDLLFLLIGPLWTISKK